jgi:exopolyphosphatase/guanosine-5'-triphosphate,3'-diphosphate pyrophosphatase
MARGDRGEVNAPRRFLAIDVGSNALRLAVAGVQGDPPFLVREASFRVPLRLGKEVFTTGTVHERTVDDLVEVFEAFSHLIAFFRPEAVRACATSALREAKNGGMVASRVRKETGIPLEIISGAAEAELILSMREKADDGSDHMYIDVGGGSTELTWLRDGKALAAESFRIGGVRILSGRMDDSEWDRMRAWIDGLDRGIRPVSAVGTGGNIEKLHELSLGDTEEPLTRHRLREILESLEPLSVEDRMRKFRLKPDRADVIVPAGRVYHQVLKWANIRTITVPKTGLADGILQGLFRGEDAVATPSRESGSGPARNRLGFLRAVFQSRGGRGSTGQAK